MKSVSSALTSGDLSRRPTTALPWTVPTQTVSNRVSEMLHTLHIPPPAARHSTAAASQLSLGCSRSPACRNAVAARGAAGSQQETAAVVLQSSCVYFCVKASFCLAELDGGFPPYGYPAEMPMDGMDGPMMEDYGGSMAYDRQPYA